MTLVTVGACFGEWNVGTGHGHQRVRSARLFAAESPVRISAERNGLFGQADAAQGVPVNVHPRNDEWQYRKNPGLVGAVPAGDAQWPLHRGHVREFNVTLGD